MSQKLHYYEPEGLTVDCHIRTRRAGISGTSNKQLKNEFQIKEALHDMCNLINGRENVIAKCTVD